MTHAPTMVSLVEDYLAARRQMGFALGIAGGQLLAFGRFADQAGHCGPVTLDLAVRWAQSSRRHTSLTWARRLEVLRPFAKYRSQFDAGTAVLPTTFFGPAHRRLVPHIYTEQEIVALLKATDNLLPVGGLRPLTYRTLFGLLAAAGLRISEALHLKPQDVDLEHELLTVRQTKFRKSRLVPLDSTVVAALAAQTQRSKGRCVLRFGSRQTAAQPHRSFHFRETARPSGVGRTRRPCVSSPSRSETYLHLPCPAAQLPAASADQ